MPTDAGNSTDRRARRPRYRFGVFIIDLATREVRRHGKLLALAPKSFDCLAYLIDNRERAVGRDELTAAVWGRADVTDAQLRQLMYKTRYAVSDSSGSQAVIRTIPHFGFRWVAELEECSEAGASISDAAAVSPASLPRPLYPLVRVMTWLAIFAIVAIAGSYAWTKRAALYPTAGNNASTSHAFIAVLPADVDAPDDMDSGWMRLGLMDAVAKSLRKSSLDVIPSEEIAALTRDTGSGSSKTLAERVRDVTGARVLVRPLAVHRRDGWTLRLDLDECAGDTRSVEASSPDALLATHEASDRLLALLGKAAAHSSTLQPSAQTAAVLLQRVDAALLIDDFGTARQLIDAAPSTLRENPNLKLDLARVDIAEGHHDSARRLLAELAATVTAEESPLLRGQILVAMGRADFSQPDLAVRELSDAIALLEPLGEPRHLAAAYNNRAIARTGQNREREAREDYARARVAFSLVNDSLGLARIDNNEAVLLGARGRSAEALPLFESAARTFERFGALDALANPVVNQMSAYLDLVRPADALALYDRMRSRLESLQNRESHLFQIVGAAVLLRNGKLHAAHRALDSLASAVDPTSQSDLLMALGTNQAELALAEGRPDEAIAHATKVITGARESRQFDGTRAEAWLVLIHALLDSQRIAEAQSQTRLFVAWARESNEPKANVLADLAAAEQQWREGERPQADESYERSLHAAEQNGAPADVVTVAASYANALLDAGDRDQASAVFGRIGRWSTTDFTCALLQVRLYHAAGQLEAWRAALANAQALAGERPIPSALASPPSIAPSGQ